MYEAAQTNVSPAGIWAIVAVAVVCLAFWLTAIAIAARNPGAGRRRMPSHPGPVLGGAHVSDCGRSVAPNRDSAATFADSEAEALAAYPGAVAAGAADARASAPARVPGTGPEPPRRTASQPTAPAVPVQRAGDADRPTGVRREG